MRDVERVEINWGDKTRRAYQVKWDSFFKVPAPHSSVIQELIETAYRLPEPIGEMTALATDLESRRIAAAFHQDGTFKELRSDGFFESDAVDPIFGFEYQSTHNVGMPVRTFLYQEAFDEKNPGLLRDRGMHFAVIYSGHDMSAKERKKQHLSIIERKVSYLFTDLDQVSAESLEGDGLYSWVLRLSRNDATDFEQFREVAALISELWDADERNRLMEALVMASMNKPGFGRRMLELKMDEEIRRNLEEMIPVMNSYRLLDRDRLAARRVAKAGQAPDWVIEIVDETSDDEITELYERISELSETQDWDSLRVAYR